MSESSSAQSFFRSTVPTHLAEEDLDWFWNLSDGDCGLRSSHPAMVARLEVGGCTGGAPITDLDERCLEACTRHRIIRRALERLSDDQVRLLRVAFGPHAHRLPGLAQPACVASTCTCSAQARQAHLDSRTTRCLGEWLVRLFARAASSSSSAHDRVLCRAIVADAERLLQDTLAAYSHARRAVQDLASRQRAAHRAEAEREKSRGAGGA